MSLRASLLSLRVKRSNLSLADVCQRMRPRLPRRLRLLAMTRGPHRLPCHEPSIVIASPFCHCERSEAISAWRVSIITFMCHCERSEAISARPVFSQSKDRDCHVAFGSSQ